jgi:hypothetical protein
MMSIQDALLSSDTGKGLALEAKACEDKAACEAAARFDQIRALVKYIFENLPREQDRKHNYRSEVLKRREQYIGWVAEEGGQKYDALIHALKHAYVSPSHYRDAEALLHLN